MRARDLVLEQLQHVLQHLDARIEQVDALRNLEVAARGRVERLCVVVATTRRGGEGSVGEGEGEKGERDRERQRTEIRLRPEDLGRIDDGADEVDVHAQNEELWAMRWGERGRSG